MKRAIERGGDEAKRAFAKIGVLMASAARAGKPLHPTNLHVNARLFPQRHGAKPAARSRVARSAGSTSRSASTRLGAARGDDDPTQPLVAVRRDVRDGAGARTASARRSHRPGLAGASAGAARQPAASRPCRSPYHRRHVDRRRSGLVHRADAGAVCAAGRRTRSRTAPRCWPFVVGLPFAYARVSAVLFTCVWVIARLAGVRARPAGTCGSRLGERAAPVPRRVREPRSVRAEDDAVPLADAAIRRAAPATLAGAAAAWRRLQRRRLDRPAGATSRREGLGPVYALSYGPPLAPIEHLRAAGGGARSRDIERATGAPQVGDRGAQHGRPRRTRVPAPLRRRARAPPRSPSARRTPAACTRGSCAAQSLADMRPRSAYLAAG